MKEGDKLCIMGTSYEGETSYYEEDGSIGSHSIRHCLVMYSQARETLHTLVHLSCTWVALQVS